MKPLAYTVLRLLADGEFHSGEALAQQVGASRASVWNAVEDIEAAGVVVYRIRGRGYRLERPLCMLDAAQLQCWLGEGAPFAVELCEEADSTNTLLFERARQGAPHASVVAAEWQRAGRGRLQRPWHAARSADFFPAMALFARRGHPRGVEPCRGHRGGARAGGNGCERRGTEVAQ
jgi:BirA family biotin operon repressor/biotin-[acetyl-CoA-carboxylase] ligase